jgi:hypothetical protein
MKFKILEKKNPNAFSIGATFYQIIILCWLAKLDW